MKLLVSISIVALIGVASFFLLNKYHLTEEEGKEALIPEEVKHEGEGASEGWLLSEPNTQGLQFFYPEVLGTEYVHAQKWPPLVEQVVNAFACEEGEITAADGPLKTATLREIEGNAYCVIVFNEAAAGSTYTTYEYTTEQNDRVFRIVFTLRTPQCLNYDEPERTACTVEQAEYSVDALVHRIATSIRRK